MATRQARNRRLPSRTTPALALLTCALVLASPVTTRGRGHVALGAQVAQAAVEATTPLDAVRGSNAAILAKFGDSDALAPEAEAEVYQIMDGVTDFAAMSEAAVGELCTADPTVCAEFGSTFAELLRVRSVKSLGRYRAERFEYIGEEVEIDTATVNTLAYYDDEEFTLDYELRRSDSGWMIVNYVFDGSNTVRGWRTRFRRLLQEESVEEVIGRLQARIAELRAEPADSAH